MRKTNEITLTNVLISDLRIFSAWDTNKYNFIKLNYSDSFCLCMGPTKMVQYLVKKLSVHSIVRARAF